MTKRRPVNFALVVAALCILYGVTVVAACPMLSDHVMAMPCPFGKYGVWIRPFADWSLLAGVALVTGWLLQPDGPI